MFLSLIILLISLDSLKFKFNYDVYVYDIPEKSSIRLWIPLPLENEEQKIIKTEIETELKYKITKEGKFGNKMIYIESKGKREIRTSLNFIVLRYESKGIKNKFKDLSLFLKPSTLIPVNDSTFKIAKRAINGKMFNSNKEIAKKLYYYVLDYMNYDKSGEGWGRGDFWYACNYKKGNCTDFHSFFIGLSRSLNVPSFFEIGFPLPKDKEKGEIMGYHCWAYFYDNGYWVPLDISEADKYPELKEYYFGNLDKYRIAFTRGRDIILNPPQSEKALNYFIYPYAELKGKEFKNIKFKIYFEKL